MIAEATYGELEPLVGQLVAAAANRLDEEAMLVELRAQLEAIAETRNTAEQQAAARAADARASVQGLRREQLEEIQSMRCPPRAICEAIGLLSLLLRPGDFVDSVESIAWAQAVLLLDTEDIHGAIQAFDIAGVAGILLSVPAIRQVLDLLDCEESRPPSCSSSAATRGSQQRGASRPGTACSGGDVRPLPRGSCAEGAAAQLLRSGTLQGNMPGASGAGSSVSLVRGSIVCAGHDEPEPDFFGGLGLLPALRGDGDFGIAEIASYSPPVGVLLTWALCQLRCLRAQLPPRQGVPGFDAEKRLQVARSSAEVRAAQLAGEEEAACQQLLCALAAGVPAAGSGLGSGDLGVRAAHSGLGSADALQRGGAAEAVVTFAKGSALLSSLASRPLLPALSALREDPRLRISVEGTATAGEGAAVASRRSDAVAKYFTSQGVPPHRVHCSLGTTCTTRFRGRRLPGGTRGQGYRPGPDLARNFAGGIQLMPHPWRRAPQRGSPRSPGRHRRPVARGELHPSCHREAHGLRAGRRRGLVRSPCQRSRRVPRGPGRGPRTARAHGLSGRTVSSRS